MDVSFRLPIAEYFQVCLIIEKCSRWFQPKNKFLGLIYMSHHAIRIDGVLSPTNTFLAWGGCEAFKKLVKPVNSGDGSFFTFVPWILQKMLQVVVMYCFKRNNVFMILQDRNFGSYFKKSQTGFDPGKRIKLRKVLNIKVRHVRA